MLEEEYETRRVLPRHLRKPEAQEAAFEYSIREATLQDMPDIREIYNHYVANSTVTFDEDPMTLREWKSKYPYLHKLGMPFIVVGYLVLSINVYLESFAFGRFNIGYGYVGPTEMRLILIGLNTALALGSGLGFHLAGYEMTPLDLVGLAIVGVMAVMLVGRSFKNLRALAKMEPAAPRVWRNAD